MSDNSCGTIEGWRKHQRNHSQVCGKCIPVRDDYLDRVAAMRGRRGDASTADREHLRMTRPRGCELSERGWEVALLVARGLGNAQIADQLTISAATVKTHVSVILRQLGVERRSGITAALYRRGWLPADLVDTDQVSVTRELFGAMARVVNLTQHGRDQEARALAKRVSAHLPPPKTYAP